MQEYGRDFPESFKRLTEQKLFPAKFLVTFIAIIFIIDICFITIIFPLDLFSSFFLILCNNFLFLIFICERFIIRREANSQFEETALTITLVMQKLTNLKLFHNNHEKRVFRKNFESLYIFKLTQNYKYCMIAMGSMIEFVLFRYCKDHQINPDPFIRNDGKAQSGNSLSNYIQTAINKDLFGQKKLWIIIQNSLRSFRNCIHISKEVKEEEIDLSWYMAIAPIFVKLLLNIGRNN